MTHRKREKKLEIVVISALTAFYQVNYACKLE